MTRFDIRHKETLRLFLKDYFELFFPKLVRKMNFSTALFLDKELFSLFQGSEKKVTQNGNADMQRITD
jgi:hypothetical protein